MMPSPKLLLLLALTCAIATVFVLLDWMFPFTVTMFVGGAMYEHIRAKEETLSESAERLARLKRESS